MAAEGWAQSINRQPPNGEPLDSAGRYPTIMQHAYLYGTMQTLCGGPIASMPFLMQGGNGWATSGDQPPRCQVCSERAT